MKQIFIFLLFTAYLNQGFGQEKRDTNILVFRFSTGYSIGNYFGKNVYNYYHKGFSGLNVKGGYTLFDKVNMDIRIAYESAEVKDNSIIYKNRTKIRSYTFSIGGVIHPIRKSNLSLSAFYAKEKGNNQGNFIGRGFGAELDFEAVLGNYFYLVLGTELRRSYFDIHAPKDIEDQFAKANSIYFHVGIGFRLY